MLEAAGLVKSYRGRQVVNNVSLRIGRGEVVGLLGPNGAGKTTCFYMMVGLIRPDAGDVFIDGGKVTSLPIHRRAAHGLAYLPQDASIFRTLSVEDNILAILETRKDLDRQARRDRLETLLEEFNIGHVRTSKGMSLSGGERRRTEIARTLATDPGYLLLDEPFAGIDPISVADIKHLIAHLKSRDIGILLTDHNVRETLDICEKACIVSEGRIIADGEPAEILANQTVREVYLGEHFDI
ncbi:MAG: LPS export ABC transporter ATP-binding protein [Gammaproteobacteria bacterium]|nr:LPS export ABC transporter ATP-binding protein [Gammaproteobacteria bacterium]MYA67771.1 LPS export ABC transporter ATP-binding protein [Gammaproteobacteria bacterium]MYC59566.1 LPS export ABC transporter ATP-binding protein [Gammaproteobacteria bacterium]MYH47480.1 LPS export ABC transporter ATP-binding protein [Gammaproteobacteria bacterium]MYL12336.1 LPS export ABC transporter ATP-binding protein [Gammaproteobacteria bacterium]